MKICERGAKDDWKLCERSRSLRQVLAHSNFNHWFLFIFLSKLTKWCKKVAMLRGFCEKNPTFAGLPFKPKRTQATFPAKVPRKVIMLGYLCENKKKLVAKVSWKVVPTRKWNGHHLVLNTFHVFYFWRWPIPQHPGQARTREWRTTGDVFGAFQREKQGNLDCWNGSNWNSAFFRTVSARIFGYPPIMEACSERKMQTLPLALLLAEETETKFRAVHQLLVENQYEVLMVEAGARKRCTAHNPPVVGENSGDDFWVTICISQDSPKLMFKTVCLVFLQIRWDYFFVEVVNPYNPTLSVRSIDGSTSKCSHSQASRTSAYCFLQGKEKVSGNWRRSTWEDWSARKALC